MHDAPSRLVFTKGSGKFDTMTVVRDGRVEKIDCPKQGIIPHDMVHYAVEHTLQHRGFLRRVMDGEAATFQMQPEAVSEAVERLVEVFQGDAWSGSGSPAQEMIDLYAVTCAARDCVALKISAEEIDAVRARIASLEARWQVLSIGGSLTLAFEPQHA